MSTLPLAIGYFFPPAEPGVVFDGQKQDGCSSKEQPSQSVKEPLISRAARRSRQPVLGAVCKKESTIFSDGAFLERATRLELASRHPANGNGHSREPCLTSYDFTRCAQVEAASSRGCLQKRKHHLLRWCFSGADDEARTRYLDLGKVALYQMSYARKRKIDYNPAGGICQPLRSAFFSFFSG